MTETLTILAVDDERPALEDLARLIRSHDDVDEVECVTSGSEALRLLASSRFDAVFIDVRMPGLDGIELARVLRRFEVPPVLVFVSAYESGAVDAFELRALDYLMKPVSKQRLEETIGRIATELDGEVPARAAANGSDHGDHDDVVAVDTPRGGTRLLRRSSVLFLQAEGDYVRIVSDEGRHLVRGKISELEVGWQPHGFARIHRSFIANLRRAVEVRPHLNGTATLVMAGGRELPIARRKVGELRAQLHI